MNLTQLETFLAVVRAESFTKAAVRVGLSQSAVSRQIQDLERSLGAPLFERFGRTVSLTAGGRVLLSEAPRFLQEAQNIRERLLDVDRGVGGEVRIGATISASNTFIPRVLMRFRRRQPAVNVTLRPGQTKALEGRLHRNEIDLAVLGSEVSDPDLKTCFTIPDEIVLIASHRHALAGKKVVKPRQLDGLPFILREPGSDTRAVAERWLDHHNVKPKSVMDLW